MLADKINILVVEDNPGDARLIKEAFRGRPEGEFNLVHAPGLQSAFKRLSEDKVDFILLDLNLPGTSGLETLRKLQANDSQTPVLVLTGLRDEQTALQAIRLGAQGYFCKDSMGRTALARTLHYAAERRQIAGNPPGDPAPPAVPALSAERQASFASLDGLLGGPGDLLLSDDSDVLRIPGAEKMEVRFQPWVSTVEKNVVGFEGLFEGKGLEAGNPLSSPASLLRKLNSSRFSSTLDHLSRRKLLLDFRPASKKNPGMALGLAFDIAGPDGDGKTLDDLHSMVRGLGLPPDRIVMDIQESQPCAINRLKRFAENSRSRGFLLALEGSRLGPAHLDLLTDLKPDLIKADRGFIAGIEKSHEKRELFKSLVSLAHASGSLVLAQGVETEAEALRILDLGADLIQGGTIAGPRKLEDGLWKELEEKTWALTEKFKNYMSARLRARKTCRGEYSQLLYAMGRELADMTPDAFEVILFDMAQRFPRWESLTVLDRQGKQLCRVSGAESPALSCPAFFSPFPAGSDHSTRDYFYELMDNRQKDLTYFTEPYLSRENRKLCVTISTLFKDVAGETHVLCAQVSPERLLIQC